MEMSLEELTELIKQAEAQGSNKLYLKWQVPKNYRYRGYGRIKTPFGYGVPVTISMDGAINFYIEVRKVKRWLKKATTNPKLI